jgi:hypothetical protein
MNVFNTYDWNRLRRHCSDVRRSDIVDIDTLEQVWDKFEIALVETSATGNTHRSVVEKVRENMGCVFERLAVEQTSNKKVTLFPERELVVEIDVSVLGQETLALEFDKRGCDQKELGGDLQVEMLKFLDLDEIGVDDSSE